MRTAVYRYSLISIVTMAIMLWVLVFVLSSSVLADDFTLDQAMERAIGHSSRASIIEGNFQVAEQNYKAKRINFYLPEISINGALPSYDKTKRFDYAPGETFKSTFETRDLGFRSFIRLKQSLITGGDLDVTANLTANDGRYPDYSTPDLEDYLNEDKRGRVFNFSYSQPLLKPSDSKNELRNRKDDLEIARFGRVEELQGLKTEVVEAYMEVLRTELKLEIARLTAEKGQEQSRVDSIKFQDGVISEEGWLESSSARLDAELAQFEADTEAKEQSRTLSQLLDLDVSVPVGTSIPPIPVHPTPEQQQFLIDSWESTVAIQKAEFEYKKSKRAADYAAGSHGLTGDLSLDYSFGKDNVTEETYNSETGQWESEESDPSNSNWGISLNFTYPIWDGGSSRASVNAAQHEAEKARLEFEKAKQSARAQIINAVNRLDVSHKRMEIVRKQIDLAKNKLNIAESRKADGQISELTYLENKIFYLETQDRYLEELKNYLVNKIELDHKFIDG